MERNRYAIEVKYRLNRRTRRLTTGSPDRSLMTIVDVLQQLAALSQTNVEIVHVAIYDIEGE